MITFFTVPRPFGVVDSFDYGKIQTNAIKSWRMICPDCDIIAFGDDDSVKAACKELNVKHIPGVKCDGSGVPSLDCVFDIVKKRSRFDALCYCNTDVILVGEIKKILKAIRFDKYMLIGRRYDCSESIDIDNMDLTDTISKSKWHAITGVDYFVFKKDLYPEVKPFLVGRFTWDNWLVYEASRLGAIIIDCTNIITAIHQNHPILSHRDPIVQKQISENWKLAMEGDKKLVKNTSTADIKLNKAMVEYFYRRSLKK